MTAERMDGTMALPQRTGMNWRGLGLRLGVIALVIGAGVALNMLFPGHAFAQQDPFAGAEDGFLKILNRLKFWVWGFSALGLAFYVIAFGGQSLWPQFYGSMRDFLRTGALLLVVFNVVFGFLLSQATSAKGGFVVVLPFLIWRLRVARAAEQRAAAQAAAPQDSTTDHVA